MSALIHYAPPYLVSAFVSLLHWTVKNIETLARDDWAGVRFILAAFSVFLAGLVAVGIHEVGHLIAGTAMSFRFKSMHCGPVRIDRSLHISRYQAGDSEHLG
ncbi:MAG TPA: hypothetical protein VEW69_13035, partial [Alphaproteobacteria bacterium]|nr:hypothetical protein [Alphaproteobacteria bacterium]